MTSTPQTLLQEAVSRIMDMLQGDDGQAFKEARKFIDRLRDAALQAAPPAPAAVAVPVEDMRDKVTLALGLSLAPKGGPSFAWSYLLDSIRELVKCEEELVLLKAGQEMSKARAALAAAPAQALDDRAAFKAYLQECDDCEIVPDVAGAFHAAWQKRAAPAQAVAVPDGWKLVPIQDTPGMWTAGGRAIKACMGHERDAASVAYKAMVDVAPAAPAQEHATQLAGQCGEQDEGLAQAIDERDTAEGWADGLAELIGAYFGQDIGEHSSAHNPWQEAKDIIEEAEPYRPAAAPAQAQEDARDATVQMGYMHPGAFHPYQYKRWQEGNTVAVRLNGWKNEHLQVPVYAKQSAVDAARAAQGGAA